MKQLTKLIFDDMKPSLGVTEPGAIAFSVAKARSYTKGDIQSIHVVLNSGMYKNAFTCGIPNSTEVGNAFAAALGAIAGKSEKGLLALDAVTQPDNDIARKLIDDGKVTVSMSEISSTIFIEATVQTSSDEAVVTIRDSHINVTSIRVNDIEIFARDEKMQADDCVATENGKACSKELHPIKKYTVNDFIDYIETVDIGEIEFITEAFRMNMALFNAAIKSERTVFTKSLLAMNGGKVISTDDRKTASLLCNGAIEGRVLGLDKPAMSITGSGSHGIIATMPLYAYCKIHGLSDEKLIRSTALSYLICTYIKEYSGKLSAFCGCAIAAGTGAACSLTWLKGGNAQDISNTINNMASSITGMICHGGNHGCTMKGIIAVDAAYNSAELSMSGAYIPSIHGINGITPEITMQNIGLIASPGMVGTEKVIVDIFEDKSNKVR
ncbi:MAG: L-serine ammonia-lyase, iron-sulfur-dependent, subunit alpha [Eubacteriales bacterium]|nr:L-serine ammonia-lyase, iron-sulfur-dependent, subunit alpha [Eubacteriales bacterium]